MVNFELKKEGVYYSLTFTKLVHKRTGEIVEEPGETHYTLPLSKVKYYITVAELLRKLQDKDVSLKEYILEFDKTYQEVCKLLKKTLS